MRIHWALASVFIGLFACGDNLHPAADAGGGSDAAPPAAVCGDGIMQAGEDCDDGDTKLDSACDATCHFTCGNGVVDAGVGEACDSAIPAGSDGACPTSCDDGDACTTDAMSGDGCTAACVHGAITAPAAGDGCCPAGANANTDSDCPGECGNAVLEPGETCDTGITSGAGKCPTTCDDGQACTTDALVMGATCLAACTATPITMAHDGDGCCPTGATSVTDNDCKPTCGNGKLDAGELCDTGIASGAGKCPTACSDGVACTTDTLLNGGTCTAACGFTPIVLPKNGDGCCPTGANQTNDNDCAAVCGNSVKETGEDCDNGILNGTPGNACSATCKLSTAPTAFRITSLVLKDPHVFVNFISCSDITNPPGLLNNSVNGLLANAITMDADMPPDGNYDLSFATVFRPLVPATTATTPLDFYVGGDCTTATPSACSPGAATKVSLTATNAASGTCLAPITTPTTTLGGYTPGVTSATGPCYASNTTTLSLTLGGIPITLTDAQIGATYVGNPATGQINGLVRGFISEADANTVMVPLPVLGNKPLSSLLKGGTGSCASGSDKDKDGSVTGWWFYLNFTADKAGWTD